MTRPQDIDGYIASAPPESQSKLRELRKIIKILAPQAEEGISYGMPAFKLHGQPFIGFAGYKHHVGFYPMSGSFLKAYEKDLKNYKTSAGAVQFSLDRPLPVSLIKKLVKGKMRNIQKAVPSKSKILLGKKGMSIQ